MILILTHPDDPGSDGVEELLRQRGADVVRFDPADFPTRAALSMRYLRARDRWQRVIEREGAPAIDLDTIGSVWLRRPGARQLPADLDPAVREYVAEEWNAVAGDLFSGLDVMWLPARPAVVHETTRKCHPMLRAHKLGFAIPDTAFTSRPEDLFALHRAHAGRVVSKLPSSLAFAAAFEPQLHRYSEKLSARDLGYARRVRSCPVLVQEDLARKLEIQVTVVGQHVFAAELDAPVDHRARRDRRRGEPAVAPLRVHELPRALERRCVALTRGLGLSYAAIELALTPDDEYVFLGLDPAGEFGWIEEATRLPIARAVADALLAATPRADARFALWPRQAAGSRSGASP